MSPAPSPNDPPPPAQKPRATFLSGVDPNLVVAAGVLIASLGALFVYVQQARIMREQTNVLIEQTQLLQEQTKANAWPSLQMELLRSMGDVDGVFDITMYELKVANRGTGPAIVERAEVAFGQTPARTWSEFYNAAAVPDTMESGQSNEILNGRIIQAGEQLDLVGWTMLPGLRNYLHARGDSIAIRICYRSVYGDSWEAEREGFYSDEELTVVRPVDSCTLAAATAFLN